MHVSIIKRETKPPRFAREVHTRVWLSSRLCFPAPWPHGALKDAGALPPPCLWDLSALGTFNISHLPKETQAQTRRAPAQVHSPAGTALLWDVPMEHQVVLLPPGSSVPLPCMNLAEGVSSIWRAAAPRGCADGEQQRPRGFLRGGGFPASGRMGASLAKSRGRQHEAVLAVM